MIFRFGRYSISLLYLAALMFAPIVHAESQPAAPLITVYKTPT